MDFFAGSGTTAHAVMELNAADGGNRKWILCQLDEPVKAGSEAEQAGYATIDQIARERITRAAKLVDSEQWPVIKKEKKEELRGYGCIELSRANCMVEGDAIWQS